MLTYPVTLLAPSGGDPVAFTFQSIKAVATAYSVTYTGSDTITWTDGTDTYTGASITFLNWNDTSLKTVTVTVVDFENITNITGFVNGVSGIVNCGNFTGFAFNFNCYSNSTLTQVIPPTDSPKYHIYNNDITGILDFSTVEDSSFQLKGYSNSSLTGFLQPQIAFTSSVFYLYNCDFTGTLTINNCTIGQFFKMNGNSNLTDIVHKTQSAATKIYWVNDCDLDYYDLTVISSFLKIDNFDLQMQDSLIVVADVNHFLVDFAAMVVGESGGGDYTGRDIDISGTNDAPNDGTGAGGGYDGDQAVLDLVAMGITVTTS